MSDSPPIGDLIRRNRPGDFAPMRLGGRDVVVETGFRGSTFVYLIRGGRVVVVRGGESYREDVAVALLDAVDDLIERDDLGSTVHLREIDIPGCALDRAALLGPGHTSFFSGRPELADRGIEVVPVHRSEVAEDTLAERFHSLVLRRKALGISHMDWTRVPTPQAKVLRLDGLPGGILRPNRNARTMSKPAVTQAKRLFDLHLKELAQIGQEFSVRDVRGHELRLRRDFDRLCGTLHLSGSTDSVEVDIPFDAGWEAFGPLFSGAPWDQDALHAAPREPRERLLEMRAYDRKHHRTDTEFLMTPLSSCLGFLRLLTPTTEAFLVFKGRNGGVVQVAWSEASDSGELQLWLETPEPERRRSRGRHVTLVEAEVTVSALANEDRVAVDDLGGLSYVEWVRSPR